MALDWSSGGWSWSGDSSTFSPWMPMPGPLPDMPPSHGHVELPHPSLDDHAGCNLDMHHGPDGSWDFHAGCENDLHITAHSAMHDGAHAPPMHDAHHTLGH